MQNIRQFSKAKSLLCMLLAFVITFYIASANFFSFAEGETIEPATYSNSISGVLWADTFEDASNGISSSDGTRQSEEKTLSGYSVSLYNKNDSSNAVSVTQTDSAGTYEFVGIEPGTYVVGVAAETVNGTEYLLPLTITSDNKFASVDDAAAAYTDPIELTGDNAVTGIDVGMRTQTTAQQSTTIKPMWVYQNYEIYNASNTLVGIFSSLWDCGTFINAGTAAEYTILVKGDDTSAGGMYIDRAGIKITLTSDGSAKTIGAGGDGGGWAFLQINSSSELVLRNITLDNTVTSLIQIGIQIESGGILTMESGTTVQNYDTNFGAVMVGNSTFNMTSGTISGNVSRNSSGGGVDLSNSTFNMTGGTISGNKSLVGGGGVFMQYGVFTMGAGSQILNNESDNDGGGVSLLNSTFVLNGGTISGNAASGSGGGVQLSGSTFTMTGGSISSNNASNSGGGVNVTSLDDGTLSKGSFNLLGGEISSNNAASGGGVFVSPACSFYMKNNGSNIPKISDNSASDDGGGVYVYYNNSAISDIGIFEMSGGVISGNQTVGTDESSGGGIVFFVSAHSGSSSLPVYLTGGEITHNKAATGGGISFINTSNALVEFVLNGTMIGGASGKGNEAVQTANNGGSGGGISTTTGDIGINLVMKSGTISYNTSEINAGGIYCDPGTSFVLENGSISNNATQGSGGGVFFHTTSSKSGTLSMTGGNVMNNSAYEGGGLYVCAWSNSSISGGTISGNKASNSGGGIHLRDGGSTLTLSNATVSGNEAINNGWGLGQGGGIYVCDPAGLSVRNTIIENNSAPNGGGGVFTTTTYQSNAPEYYANLDIDTTVTFRGNTALKSYEPPKATTIATYFTTVKDATNTTSTTYTHALNNFDINRTLFNVVITYLDNNYNSFNPPWPVTISVANGDAFAYSSVESVPGYEFVSWRATGDADWRNNTTVELDYILQNTDIFLYFLPTFEFYKVNENDEPMEGVVFELYKWIGTGDPGADQQVTETSIGTDWTLVEEVTSNGDGLVSLLGLTGIYHLVETKTGEGYQLPHGQWRLTMSSSGTLTGGPQLIGDPSPAFFTNTVDGKTIYYLPNFKSTELPHLGGIGTLLFAISGIVLIGTAILLGIWFHKKDDRAVP